MNSGKATLIDDTLFGNSATYGGGIGNHATVTLDDVTIAGNTAVTGRRRHRQRRRGDAEQHHRGQQQWR